MATTKTVATRYGEKLRLVLAWDNWPVHHHEKVVSAAKEQRIELLFLPTCAPWTNPIEKLWRMLNRKIIFLHRCAEDWNLLKQRIGEFLNWLKPPDKHR